MVSLWGLHPTCGQAAGAWQHRGWNGERLTCWQGRAGSRGWGALVGVPPGLPAHCPHAHARRPLRSTVHRAPPPLLLLPLLAPLLLPRPLTPL